MADAKTADDLNEPDWIARHPVYTALIALAVVTTVLIGVWIIPESIVDTTGFTDSKGDKDYAAIQSAYNAVRAPIGLVLASFLAGSAALLGVRATTKSLRLTQTSLHLTRVSLDDAQTRHSNDSAAAIGRDVESLRRWSEEQLNQRFVSAADQLGDAKAAVRLAGVYAMARLADEWARERQTCVDVLCAYLRMTPTSPESLATDEIEVRRTIQKVLAVALRADSSGKVRWDETVIDLSGAALADFDFVDVQVSKLLLSGTTLSGTCSIAGMVGLGSKWDNIQTHGRVKIALRSESPLLTHGLIVHDGETTIDLQVTHGALGTIEERFGQLMAEVRGGKLLLNAEPLRAGGVAKIGMCTVKSGGQLLIILDDSEGTFAGELIVDPITTQQTAIFGIDKGLNESDGLELWYGAEPEEFESMVHVMPDGATWSGRTALPDTRSPI